MPEYFGNHRDMIESAGKTVADNLRRLMRVGQTDRVTQAALAKKAHCDQRTIGRVLACEQSPTIDLLENIAAAFDLQAWQLLVPDLDPSNPPINHITEDERRLYARLKEAARLVMQEEQAGYVKK